MNYKIQIQMRTITYKYKCELSFVFFNYWKGTIDFLSTNTCLYLLILVVFIYTNKYNLNFYTNKIYTNTYCISICKIICFICLSLYLYQVIFVYLQIWMIILIYKYKMVHLYQMIHYIFIYFRIKKIQLMHLLVCIQIQMINCT